MKKLLYIVLDGLGDRPIKELGNKTPLEAAKTKNMDGLAKAGRQGFVYTVGKGIAPESDIAVISILGYDAHKYYTGRGPLESYAAGLDVSDGDLAYRVNFATCEVGSNKLLDRRVGRNLTTKEATALAAEVNEKVKLTKHPARAVFKNTVGHRGVVVIYRDGGRLSAEVSNTDPAYERHGVFGVAKEKFENVALACEPLKNNKESKEAAELTNEFVEKSRVILEASSINKKRLEDGKLQANIILARDAGDGLPKFPKLSELYGLNFGCFVEMPVERGIALLTGMDVVELPLPTGDLEKDYTLRADKVISSMKSYDGLYIHIKGPDEPAHDGDFKTKTKSIEVIDEAFFGRLLPKIDLKNTIIAITADHSTPCGIKAHSDDPVPFLVVGGSVASDGLKRFGEREARGGSIGELAGPDIMPLLVKSLK
jgi:2,3-bisphosphoglycerate-independent phosphoglycerate mutase